MRFIKEQAKPKEYIRPYTGDKRDFTYFAWFPQSFYNKETRTRITIWFELYSVTRTYYRGAKQRYDFWSKGGDLVGVEGFKME